MDYSRFWQNELFSDAKLYFKRRNVPSLPGQERGDGEPPLKKCKEDGGQMQGNTVAQLSVHAVVLATASGYWASRLERWDVKTATAMVPTAPEVSGTGAEAVSPWALEEQVDDQQDADIALLVLCYAYTNKLPDSATALVLLQMAVWADKWEMLGALSACMAAAAQIKGLSLPDLEQVLQHQLPESITSSKEYKHLQQHLGQTLCQHVGPAQDVLVSEDKLLSFRNLSSEAVQLWASQDQLQTDSEDTVAVLLTHWWHWHKKVNCLDRQQQEVAAEKLTEVFRAGQLSSSFIQCVLGQLPWVNCSTNAPQLLNMLHGTDLRKQDILVRDMLPAAWMLPRRIGAQQAKPFLWAVTRAQLDKLHKQAGSEQAQLSSPPFCWHGLNWYLVLSLDSQKAYLLLSMEHYSALPGSYTLPPVLFPSFDLLVRKGVGTKCSPCNFVTTDPLLSGYNCFARNDFLGVPESQEPRTHSYPPDEFWKEGKLHFEVKMKAFK